MKVKYMKKYVYLIAFLFGFTSAVNANGVNIGISVIGGVFDADGAEKFTGDHVSGASADDVTKKTATEGDEAETAFYFGSLCLKFHHIFLLHSQLHYNYKKPLNMTKYKK